MKDEIQDEILQQLNSILDEENYHVDENDDMRIIQHDSNSFRSIEVNDSNSNDSNSFKSYSSDNNEVQELHYLMNDEVKEEENEYNMDNSKRFTTQDNFQTENAPENNLKSTYESIYQEEYQQDFYNQNNKSCAIIKVQNLKKNNYSFLKNYLIIQKQSQKSFVLNLKKVGSLDLQNIDNNSLINEINKNELNDVITLEFEPTLYNLTSQLSSPQTVTSVQYKLIILLSVTLGIQEIHDQNFVHGNISINSIQQTRNLWKIAPMFKQDLNEFDQNNFKIQNSKYIRDEIISLSLDIQDFGLLFFELLTGIKVENLRTSGKKKIQKQEIKVLLNELNQVLDKHLLFNQQINKKSFKRKTFQILIGSLRNNPSRRLNIKNLVNNLFTLLEFYQ